MKFISGSGNISSPEYFQVSLVIECSCHSRKLNSVWMQLYLGLKYKTDNYILLLSERGPTDLKFLCEHCNNL